MRKQEYISVISWVCVFVAVATINVSAHAESKKETIFPLTMSIDHEDHLSSLYIKCNIEDFSGAKLEDFINENNKNFDGDLKKIFRDIKQNDKQAFLAKGLKWKKKNDTENVRTRELAERNLSGIRALKQMYEQRSSGFKIYKRLLIGDGGMVIWGTDKNAERLDSFTQRRAFRYRKQRSGEIQWDCAEEWPDAFQGVITHAFQKAAEDPKRYKKDIVKEKMKFDYEIEIPGDEGAEPAYLLFNGKEYDGIDIVTEAVPADDEVLSFYQEAYHAWLFESSEAFAQYYTEKSKGRILDAIATNSELLDDYKEPILQHGRKVVFVLDAYPFYVVFYRLGGFGSVLSELVVKDPATGKLKLTNLGMGDLTSQYLASSNFYLVLNKVNNNKFPIERGNEVE